MENKLDKYIISDVAHTKDKDDPYIQWLRIYPDNYVYAAEVEDGFIAANVGDEKLKSLRKITKESFQQIFVKEEK